MSTRATLDSSLYSTRPSKDNESSPSLTFYSSLQIKVKRKYTSSCHHRMRTSRNNKYMVTVSGYSKWLLWVVKASGYSEWLQWLPSYIMSSSYANDEEQQVHEGFISRTRDGQRNSRWDCAESQEQRDPWEKPCKGIDCRAHHQAKRSKWCFCHIAKLSKLEIHQNKDHLFTTDQPFPQGTKLNTSKVENQNFSLLRHTSVFTRSSFTAWREWLT